MDEKAALVRLSAEDEEVLTLLRKPGLSIKYLDEPTKQKLKDFIQRLHVEKGISLSDIAKMIGNKTSGYTSWVTRQLGIQPRDFEEARLKGIHEKVRKYERKPFDGTDEDKAYLLGLRHGDLSASRPFGDAVRVSTSTTHLAMAKLFRSLFEPYGHVYQHPRFKKDQKTYEWNLHTIVDDSFGFLLDPRESCRGWVARGDGFMLSYLAGFIDAEGTIGINPAHRYTSVNIGVYNTDVELLKFVYESLVQLKCKPLSLYLEKRAGFISPGFRIRMNKDYYRVLVLRFNEVQTLLQRLPVRHYEKVARRDLALSISARQPWESIKDRVKALADLFDRETRDFTKQAEIEFLKNHPEQISADLRGDVSI